MEKIIKFYIDDVESGSATLFIENGKIDLSDAEHGFYKAVRYDRQQLIEDEREFIIDNLDSKQEDKLKDACMKDYHGDKEHWEDAYERFIEDLSLDELKKILV